MSEKFIVTRLMAAAGVWLPVYIFLSEGGRIDVNVGVLAEVTLALMIIMYILLAYGLRYVPKQGPYLLLLIPVWILGWCGGWLIFGFFDWMASTIGLNQLPIYSAINVVACVSFGILGMFCATWLTKYRAE